MCSCDNTGAHTHMYTQTHTLGAFLERCSQIETKLGESEKRFQEKATSSFITPLKAFLEIDVKNVLVRKETISKFKDTITNVSSKILPGS